MEDSEIVERFSRDPAPWEPMTNSIDLKHLGKLLEELNEAGAAASRCLIQGIDGVNPDGAEVNKRWLENELADVRANIELCIERFALDVDRMNARGELKKPFLRKWHYADVGGDWKCVNGHDLCHGGASAGPECPYCERV